MRGTGDNDARNKRAGSRLACSTRRVMASAPLRIGGGDDWRPSGGG